ncbi:Dienelactone hydrolase [Fusarium oxysporum f. sp. vasinfectum]|nr:Dienelactone hydrolase [Fusarium oxysporum f. sp. vasinfectum]
MIPATTKLYLTPILDFLQNLVEWYSKEYLRQWITYSRSQQTSAVSKALFTPEKLLVLRSRLTASTLTWPNLIPTVLMEMFFFSFPDAFGLHINSFLMMDAFAECGYLTLGVDYFLGDPVTKHSLTPLSDPNFDFESWKNKHLKASEEAAARWVKAVKTQYGTSEDVKFASVGYCWGARFVCQQLSADGICKVGAIAHPSFLKESDVFYVQEPIFFSVPSTDKLFEPAQRSRTIEILTENNKQFNMQVFANIGHGFASRARLTDPYEKWAKEASFKSFVDWFDFWMNKQ